MAKLKTGTTIGGATAWHAGNDGSGSGLDSDTLDGQHGSYYTSYTDTAIANLVAAAPATLDTLNELAAALGDDPNFATTVTNSIATKLNSSAYTATDVIAKIKTVDGSGSGLDADLLDGQHGSYYYSPANAPDPTLTINGDASGSATFTNLGNATLTLTVADDSHNHTIANVDGLQAALDGKVDDAQVLTNVPAGAVFTDTLYTHPTHPGDDFSVDTGVLTGATVVSDIDINVTTDTLGHVTDANGVVSTRTLTLGDLGFTGATNANYYTLPEATSTVRGGIELFSDTDQTVAANAVSSTAGRTYGVQLNSAGQAVVNVPWVDTNTVYTHPSHPGDDINLDTGPLTGATVISDLDFNVTTDTLGHVTDANATYSTRNLTYSDVGAAAASHTHSYLPLSGGTLSGTLNMGANNITMSNSNITGVNSITINDPGEGIIFSGTTNVQLYAIDDASDNIMNFSSAAELRRNNNKVWDAGNDGADSGLDADLLDGQHGSYYYPASNPNGYTSNVGDITGVTAGSGISGGGTSGTVTISHADTSTQASVNNSGSTVIQDITLDTYGHITGLTSTTIAPSIEEVVTSGQISSATASIVFTNLDFSLYDYQIVYRNFVAATNGGLVYLQFSSTNGSSWLTSSYSWAVGTVTSAGTYGDIGNNGTDSQFRIQFSGTNSTYSNGGSSGAISVSKNWASQATTALWNDYTYRTDNYRGIHWGGGRHESAATINAMRLYYHTGNIANGGYTLYRKDKS